MEIWKNIKDFPNYRVSNYGDIKSLERKVDNGYCIRTVKEKILKKTLNHRGYYYVTLYNDFGYKRFPVHKLVAIGFLNHTPCGMIEVVDHINNNPKDNRVENLQIITQRENSSKDKKGYTSRYVGVGWSNYHKKWRARIQLNGIDKHLGWYGSEEEARDVYLNAIK